MSVIAPQSFNTVENYYVVNFTAALINDACLRMWSSVIGCFSLKCTLGVVVHFNVKVCLSTFSHRDNGHLCISVREKHCTRAEISPGARHICKVHFLSLFAAMSERLGAAERELKRIKGEKNTSVLGLQKCWWNG